MPRPKISPKSESEIKVKARLIAESLIEESNNGMIYAGDLANYISVECSAWAKAEHTRVKRQVRLILKEKKLKISNKPINAKNTEEESQDYENIYHGFRFVQQMRSYKRMSKEEQLEMYRLYISEKEQNNSRLAKKHREELYYSLAY